MSLFTVNNVIIKRKVGDKETRKRGNKETSTQLIQPIMLTHKDLKVWQKSIDMVVEIYLATSSFPKEELYGLTSQIRRASVSIPSNIAEGYGRFSEKELVRFLFISLGSASEVETQLIICNRLNYLKKEDFDHLSLLNNEIIKMLAGLIKSKNNGSMKNPDLEVDPIK